jgi:lipopolysaccharide export system protein LptA
VNLSPYLQVYADQLTINKAKNQAHFRGEVIIWCGDNVLKTTKVDIVYKHSNNKDKITS